MRLLNSCFIEGELAPPRGRGAPRSTNPRSRGRRGRTGPQVRLANQEGDPAAEEAEYIADGGALEDPFTWMFSEQEN